MQHTECGIPYSTHEIRMLKTKAMYIRLANKAHLEDNIVQTFAGFFHYAEALGGYCTVHVI